MSTDLLELTAQLVAIPSVSRDEQAITDHLERLLRDAPHLALTRHGNNLVARTALNRPMRLLLAGHTDTVPVNGNFPGRIEGDVLHGLGAADMKSGVAVILDLALTVASPVVDVTYVFYDCEEIESEANGLRRLFGEAPALMSADAAILCEPTGARVEAGCQGTMKVVVSMSGVRAHTARPWTGVNAIHRLGPVIDRLESYSPRRPVIEGFEYREAVQAVGIDGGVAGNVVPDLATLTINHRFAPDHTPEEAEALLREIVGEVDGFEVVDVAAGAPPGFDHPLLAGLVERSGSTPRAKLGWTDVARFAERDVPAANFGPGDPLLAHRPDERVERHDIELVSEALRAVLEKRI